MPKERRGIRITKNQLKILLNEMESNPNLRSGMVKSDYSSLQKAKDWACLARKLNAEDGAVKCVTKWKKSWCDYKVIVRKKYRDIKLELETGGVGTSLQKEMTSLERRVLNLIEVDTLEGEKISEKTIKPNQDIKSELEKTDRDTSQLEIQDIKSELEKTDRGTSQLEIQAIKSELGKTDRGTSSKNEKKATRVTKYQLRILVREMENNKNLNESVVKPNYSSLQRAKDWACLARKLNAAGGAEKCVDKWKKTWWDYRMLVKKKHRDIKLEQEKGGEGTSLPKEITPLERRVLNLTGNHSSQESKVPKKVKKADLEKIEIDASFEDELTPLERRVLKLIRINTVERLKDIEVLPKVELTFEAAPTEESPWSISQVSSLSKDSLPSNEPVVSSEPQPQIAVTSTSSDESRIGSSSADDSKHLLEVQLATASAMTEVVKALQSIADNQTKLLEIENRKVCAFEKIAEYFCK